MQSLIETTSAYTLLQKDSVQNSLAHAYLLHFEDATNLRKVLKILATLFFSNATNQRINQLIEKEIFTDCLFYPQTDKKFTVEDAEKISEECVLKPVEGEQKAFVICDFQTATPASQNKLLKLLEEPPKGVVFLLGTTSLFPILPTVLSRVKIIKIDPFLPHQIAEYLKRKYPDFTPTDILSASTVANGCLGQAESMLEGGVHRQMLTDAFALTLCKSAELPVLCKKLADYKYKKELLTLLRFIFRDALLLKTGIKKENLLLQTEKLKLLHVAEKYTIFALAQAQERISKAEKQLFFNGYFPQCLEVLLANINADNERN